MTTNITRVTMIRIPSEEHQTIALEGFKSFTKNQKRNGKPYILSMEMGHIDGGQVRDQGYTMVTKSVFETAEDMKFYEDECPAHEEYKQFLKQNAPVEGLISVYYKAEATLKVES